MIADHALIGSRYQLLDLLGRGGMGSVHRALDRLTGQQVALKQVEVAVNELAFITRVTHPALDPHLALANEFQALATLRHPNIIHVLDYGFGPGKQPYFTMTLLDRPRDVLEAGVGRPIREQVQLAVQMLQALAYIHRRGLLHRDLKPTNVLVSGKNHVYVLDFGLARDHDADDGGSGGLAGTLPYLAPEVLTREQHSVQSDLYALGVILYEMLAGFYPFQADSITEMIGHILTKPVDYTRIAHAGVLHDIVMRLMLRSPDDRYDSADAVIDSLREAYDLPVESLEIRESYLQAATFVGREREFGQLFDSLNGMLERRSSAINDTGTRIGAGWLIGGESGVGKSRLVDEVRTRAMLSGALTLRGQAVSDGGLAYQLWRDVVRRLLLIAPVSDEDAALLRMLVPDIASLLNRDVPPEPVLDQQTTQRQLMLSVSRMFRSVLERMPVVLILEDLQWASESLAMLREIAPLTFDYPLLAIGTYRNDERPNLPAELPNMEPLPLARLSADEIARLSASMLGTAGQRHEVIDLINRETEGNCFFVVEVVRALAQEAGRLSEIGRVTLPPQIFSGGIRRIVEYRLSRVPLWARPLLDLAAIYGRRIDGAVLRRAAPQINYDEWLTACINAAVFDAADGEYRFAHDKLREGLLAALPDAQRPDLFRRVAEAIEAVHGDSSAEFAYQLVGLWQVAGDPAREGHYAFLAAKEAYRVEDHLRARQFYQRALALNVHERDANPARMLADLYFGIGRASYGISDYDAVYAWQQRALEQYRLAGDRRGEANVLFALGEVNIRQTRHAEGKALTEQARAIFESLGDAKQVAYCDMSLSIIMAEMGDLRSSLALRLKNFEIMKASGDRLALARALNNLAATYDLLGEHELAMKHYMDCLTLRRELNDRVGTAYTLRNMAGLLTDQKRYAEAHMMFQEALQRLRAIGEKLSIANVLQGMGELAHRRQRYDDAREALLESLALCREANITGGIRFALRSLAELSVDEGKLAAAYDYQRQLIATTKLTDVIHWRADALMIAARIAEAENRPARAAELVAAVRALRERDGLSLTLNDEILDRCRARLDPLAYAAALTAGVEAGVAALFAQIDAESRDQEETR